jgi:hypothetical protein
LCSSASSHHRSNAATNSDIRRSKGFKGGDLGYKL